MKFYCVCGRSDASVELLEKSSREKGLEFIKLDPVVYDYTKSIPFTKGDLLYRVSTSKKCADLEKFLINKEVTTLYKSYFRSVSNLSNILIYEKENIPRPKTIYRLTRDKEILAKYSEYLGFPLIIKAMGGSHGIGIIKVDSLSSLFSIADYLLSRENDSFVMKEFINVTCSARLIVLGNEVIGSIQYSAPKGDFRSNEGATPNVSIKKFSEEIEKVAIAAVNALDLEFGGVDILIDEKNKPHVVEVNFPCFFPRCQMLTGKDISGMMIDYLIKKSKKA